MAAPEIEDQIIELLKDHLTTLGYTGISREMFPQKHPTREGIFILDFQCMDDRLKLTRRPKCRFFIDDMYPTQERGEAFFHVYNWIGEPSKRECQRIADHLTRQGIPARATTHKKSYGVRFKFDWKL